MNSKVHSSLASFAMALFGVGENKVRERKVDTLSRTPPIENGHKPFIVNGETVFALNKKNAEKKYWKALGEKPWNK